MVENELEQLVAAASSSRVPPVVPQDDDDSVDLAEVFWKLLRERRTILRVTLLIFVVVTVVAFLIPFQYTSNTSFIPPATLNSNGSMASLVAGQLSSMGMSDLLGNMKTTSDLYAGILKSHSIADDLIKRFDLMHVYRVKKESQAEKILAADTEVTIDSKSTIVSVEVTAKSAQLAHDLASAYMDDLRDTNGRLALSQAAQRRLFFEQQLVKEKDDLADAEVALKQTEEQSGLIAPTGQTTVEIEAIAQTQAQIALREVQLAALRDSATEQNPEVVQLRSEIGDLQSQLARLQKGSANPSTATIPTKKVPELELEYVRKERDVKYHEALFDMLSRQYEAARLDEARDSPVLQVLDSANYPDSKSSPKRLYYMLGGLLFGFVAGCFWVLMRDRLHAFRASLVSRATA